MSLFDSKPPRYSNHHISHTYISQSHLGKDGTIAPEDTDEKASQVPEASQDEQLSRSRVAPIRSLSTRQHPHYPSSSELRSNSTHHNPSARQPGKASSATIVRTIQTLESLLGKLDRIAGDAERFNPVAADPPTFRRVSTKLSPALLSRVERLPLDPPVHAPATPPSVHRTLRRCVTFSDQIAPGNTDLMRVHSPSTLRACQPVHLKIASYKAAPAPAEVSHGNGDSALKPFKYKTQLLSRFHEGLSPEFAVEEVNPTNENKVVAAVRRPSESTISRLRKDYRRRVRANQPPQIFPRSTSVRVSGEEEDRPVSRFPNTLKPAIQDREPDPLRGHERHYTQMFGVASRKTSIELSHAHPNCTPRINLSGHRHVDVPGSFKTFDLHASCNHAPVARDWPVSRKRFTALVACSNAACIGLIIGIYSGEVPAIQYVIVDFHHYTILGNVFFYCAMALPILCLWPLPLLHGRKIYNVVGFSLALCLQVPQAVAVSDYRSPDVASWRQLLFLSRALSGFALGFVIPNVQGVLLDCFGASLQSQNPHQEIVDPYDVRRHGGGMGVWLGIWSFASLASISFGFTIGAFIINDSPVTWGFWTALIVILATLLLNIIAPETRRSAYRRTLREMRGEEGEFSRLARGEIKMHLESTGPYWWGEEVLAGIKLNWLMIKQPGFAVLAVYTAWVYAQFTLILMLLGALVSRYYMFQPIHVGFCVIGLACGAVIAIPFQKASWLSRARYHPPRTDSMTRDVHAVWSSHMLRRALFTILLPLAALACALTSRGPPLSVAIPSFFASLVGFLSTLALSECFGLIMEAFDTSDLQPGMTGRPARRSVNEKFQSQRTNFSCYPRICAGSAVTQFLMFIFAATATGVGGRLERRLGTMLATGVVAALLLFLTLLLIVVLTRIKDVKMIPRMNSYAESKESNGWTPVILGNPSGTMRKINVLEAGLQTRWSEIRKRNRMDVAGLTGS